MEDGFRDDRLKYKENGSFLFSSTISIFINL